MDGVLRNMRYKLKCKQDIYSGSSFDSFLEAEGIREEVEAVAIKRVLGVAIEAREHRIWLRDDKKESAVAEN